MSFTLEQLTALEAAIASGTLEVQYADRKVRYQTTADLIAARAAVENSLRAQGLLPSAAAALPRTGYAVFDRD